MEPFNKSTDAFIKKLKEKADGKTEISMLQHFGRCALDVIAKVKKEKKKKKKGGGEYVNLKKLCQNCQ